MITAERLFAERGVDAVSLRYIASTADQGNVAAVQFHFGSKAGLIEAILRHRTNQTSASRHRLLDEISANGAPTVDCLISALVLPIAEHVADPEDHFITFQARLTATGTNYGHVIVDPQRGRAVRRLEALLLKVLPERDPELVDRRLAMIIEWCIHSLATYERSVIAGSDVVGLETATQDLIDMCTAAMVA